MAKDRLLEVDISEMKDVTLPVGKEPRTTRTFLYSNKGTFRFRDANLQSRSLSPYSILYIVGIGGDFPDVVSAVAGVPSNSRIKIMEGTYVGDLVITKKIYFEGEGAGSIIDGNVSFNAGSNYSYMTNCSITGDITFNTPSEFINVVFNWISSTSVITDNNVVNSTDATYRLYATWQELFQYYAKATTTQSTFAEANGNASTHAFAPATSDSFATLTFLSGAVAYKDTTVSTYAAATTTFSSYARASRVSNTFAILDTNYQVRATGTVAGSVKATGASTYSKKATGATTSFTYAAQTSAFGTYAFQNYDGTTFTAVVLGTAGNTISLVFDGVQDIDTVVNAWNTGNPANTVAFSGRPGTDILVAGTAALFAGSTGNPITFTAVVSGTTGNSISLVYDGTATVQAVVDAWNTGNPANTVAHNGNPNGVPPAGTLNLAGGTAGNAVTFIADALGFGGNSISLVFDGVQDLATVVTNWNTLNAGNTVSYTGLATSVVAASTVTLAGGTAGQAVSFSAVTPGVVGNSIALVFNGTSDTIQAVVTAWNGANGGNQVAFTAADATGIPLAGTITLSGGAAGAAITFSASTLGTVGNTISLVFNGTATVQAVVTAWNGANGGNQVTFTGNGAAIPTAQTVNLSGGLNNTAVRFTSVVSGTTGNTISLVFNGTDTIQTVVTNWNTINPTKTVSTTGPNNGVVAAGTLTLAGGKTNAAYTFKADVIGTTGNAVSLTFDGILTLGAIVTAWNTGNPANTITYTGTATDILVAQTINLSGGLTNSNITFTATSLGAGGNSISLVFNGTQDIQTVVNNWNGLNPGNQVSHNGPPLGIVPAQTVNLSGAQAALPVRLLADNEGTVGNSIALVFNGTTDTLTSVIDAWNLANPANQAIYDGGTPTGVPPAGTQTLSRGSLDTSYTMTADTIGAAGNAITIVFDGVNTIQYCINVWNTANPTNTVTLTVGNQLNIFEVETMQLANGADGGSFNFIATGPGVTWNGKVIVGDGIKSSAQVVADWNTANPTFTITQDGPPNSVPNAGNYVMVNGSAATAYHFSAITPGVIGNAISLTFDGFLSVQEVVNAWNTANPGNQVLTTVVPTTIVFSTGTITLTGGAAGATVTFQAVNSGVIGNAISLVFNGIATVQAVTSNWNATNPTNQVSFVGNPTGVISAQTVNLTGGQPDVPVTFTADNLGTIGNSIILVFDGIKSFDQVTTAWNTANPTNTVSDDAVNGNYVPYAITIQLAGGLDATPVTFVSTGGPGFTLIFDGIETIQEVGDRWNLQNPGSQVAWSGRPGTDPGIVPASIVRLVVGGSSNPYILTRE